MGIIVLQTKINNKSISKWFTNIKWFTKYNDTQWYTHNTCVTLHNTFFIGRQLTRQMCPYLLCPWGASLNLKENSPNKARRLSRGVTEDEVKASQISLNRTAQIDCNFHFSIQIFLNDRVIMSATDLLVHTIHCFCNYLPTWVIKFCRAYRQVHDFYYLIFLARRFI